LTNQTPADAIPEIVNLAEDGGVSSVGQVSTRWAAWKFVLIRTEHRIHLVVGPTNLFRYHANLVDGFCRRHDIPASKARGAHQVEIYDRAVRVLGGGHVSVDPETRRIRFYGRSTAYGSFDVDTVSSILKRGCFFAGYSVLID
jgi:hypothetical protein